MKLRELIFSQSKWNSKTLWNNIQTELGGKVIHIPKIDEKETRYRDELIRDLFYRKNKSITELSKEFNLCKMRIWQIIKSTKDKTIT